MSLEKTLARADFNKARFRSFLNFIKNLITQTPNNLVWFDDLKKKVRAKSEHYKGLAAVPIEKIVGSEGRYRDFDNLFLPKHDVYQDRWENIDIAFYRDIPLPPVSLYKIGEIYFVRDGNHRVSVARAKGMEFIDAEIIEITALIKFNDIAELNAKILEFELAEFFRITGLSTLRPVNKIAIKIIGNYEILLRHIEVHKYFMGLNSQKEIPYENAVTSWYDTIYVPIIELCEKEDALSHFENAGASDLYIWIIEHWHYLKEHYGPYVGPEKAVRDFVDKYSKNTLYSTVKKAYAIFSTIIGKKSLKKLLQ